MDKYINNGKKFVIYTNISEILRIIIICICSNYIYDNVNINILDNSEITLGILICLFIMTLTIIIEKFINYQLFISHDLIYTIENVTKYYVGFLTLIYFPIPVVIGLRFIELITNNIKIIVLTYSLLLLVLIHIIYLFSFCCKTKRNNKISNILRRTY